MADRMAILFFSKSPESSRGIVRDLESAGHPAVVTEASSVDQLREQLDSSERWDLLVIDWPEMTGSEREIVDLVRQRAPSLPCILRVNEDDGLPPFDFHQPGSPDLWPANLPQSLGPIVARALERSELRRLVSQQQEMIQRSRRLDCVASLAGPMAHELNNLLTPIMIAAEMLAEDERGGENQGLLDGLVESSRRAAEAVRQLQMFIWGKVTEAREMDMAETMRRLEQLLRFSLPKTIQLRMMLPDVPWTIAGDPAEIFQVMMALAANARDAMPDGGALTVECENVVIEEATRSDGTAPAPGRYVRILVADTGTGMPAEVLARAGEPYFSTKSNAKGMGLGLGLATCQGLVTRRGGAFQIESTEGEGTRVSVFLPVHRESPPRPT